MSKELLAQLFALNDASQSRDEYVRASFGYPGGKSRSVVNLLKILPYRKVFIDAFAGSGAVLLARNPSELEVINDRCAGITAYFRCVKDTEKCKKLVEKLEMTVCSREEFIWSRDTWQCDWLDDVERAARWYYTVQQSFGSKGWQFGRVTNGKSQCSKLHNNLQLFWPIHNRLKAVYIENQDWRVLLKDFNRNGDGTVWYIDPPYWGTVGIYNEELKKEHHLELCERIMHLDGFVALSGYDCENHPYNTFKWDKKESWEVDVTMTAMSFQDTNNFEGLEDQIYRGKARETVWIRDSINHSS